jgi:hypothetical protein
VKVLLVGPDPEQAGLRCPGVEVFERDAVKVPDPVDALSRLITIDPTIIFLSPALQVRDAVAFARTVRARPEGDRVALAAWARRSAHPALYDAGVDACLAVEDAEEEVRRQITQLVRVAERADRARQRIVDLLDRVEDIVYAHDAEGRYNLRQRRRRTPHGMEAGGGHRPALPGAPHPRGDSHLPRDDGAEASRRGRPYALHLRGANEGRRPAPPGGELHGGSPGRANGGGAGHRPGRAQPARAGGAASGERGAPPRHPRRDPRRRRPLRRARHLHRMEARSPARTLPAGELRRAPRAGDHGRPRRSHHGELRPRTPHGRARAHPL